MPRRPSRVDAALAMIAGMALAVWYAAQQGWLLP